MEHQMTRRRFGRAGAAGVLAGAALAACAGQQEGAPLPPLSTTPVTVRAFIGGIDAVGLEQWGAEMAAPYRERRPHVTVQLVPQSAEISGIKTGGTLGVVEKLVAQIAAGDPPDINDLPRAAAWQVEKGFLDGQMDNFVRRDKYDTKQFNQREFERRAVHQGEVWQIPFKLGGNTLVMVYNRDLFQSAGVAFPASGPGRPWNWNAFVETLDRLTKRAGSAISQFGLMNYGWHLGSWPLLWQTDWVSADGKTITCDNPEMLDCYSKFADLFHRHHVIPRPGEAQELFGSGNVFLNGKAAMAIMSSGSWRTYISRSELTDVALAPMPTVKISTPDVNAHSLGIIRGSKLQADAWEVIKYLNEGSRLARFSNRLPAILKDVEPWAREDLSRFPHVDAKVVLRALETHVPQINLSGHTHQDDMLRVLNPAMADLLAGEEAPVPLLKRLKPELQAIADRP
jgi:ABC-type glycerol-3-phosphate transport system substrate-binding protein